MKNNTPEGSAQHPEATLSQAAWRVRTGFTGLQDSFTYTSIYRCKTKYVNGSSRLKNGHL